LYRQRHERLNQPQELLSPNEAINSAEKYQSFEAQGKLAGSAAR
jgi:hypothetical protein